MTARRPKSKRMWGMFDPKNDRPFGAFDDRPAARKGAASASKATGRPFYILHGTFTYTLPPKVRKP